MRKRSAVLLGALCVLLIACTPGRMIIYQFSDIKDYKKFPSRDIRAAAQPFEFARNDQYLLEKDVRITFDGRRNHLDTLLESTPTVAFLVIRNDTILYENYLNKYSEESIVPSFSMAKSFTSALVGIALREGAIKSVEDSMTHYLTELRGKGLQDIRIKHLLLMTSGIKHAENYFNPFAGVAKLYYGRNLRNQMKHIRTEMEPGFYFKYKSINTQLLAMILERATGKTLSAYLEEKIWTRIGTEAGATWSIDRKNKGVEKAFCCINAVARDFARFGRLYLQKGNWEGDQVIPEDWVEASTQIYAQEGSAWYYQYQWWLTGKEGNEFFAQGHLGQYIYVNKAKNLVMVRLGKTYGKVDWVSSFRDIASQL